MVCGQPRIFLVRARARARARRAIFGGARADAEVLCKILIGARNLLKFRGHGFHVLS
jgi:hypothetical protein